MRPQPPETLTPQASSQIDNFFTPVYTDDCREPCIAVHRNMDVHTLIAPLVRIQREMNRQVDLRALIPRLMKDLPCLPSDTECKLLAKTDNILFRLRVRRRRWGMALMHHLKNINVEGGKDISDYTDFNRFLSNVWPDIFTCHCKTRQTSQRLYCMLCGVFSEVIYSELSTYDKNAHVFEKGAVVCCNGCYSYPARGRLSYQLDPIQRHEGPGYFVISQRSVGFKRS